MGQFSNFTCPSLYLQFGQYRYCTVVFSNEPHGKRLVDSVGGLTIHNKILTSQEKKQRRDTGDDDCFPRRIEVLPPERQGRKVRLTYFEVGFIVNLHDNEFSKTSFKTSFNFNGKVWGGMC